MCWATFLDTGVVIGYCFLLDDHHQNCRAYLEEHPNSDLFVSKTVEDEYDYTKRNVSRRLANAVREHVRAVKRDNSENQLGPMELDRLQNRVLNRTNDAYQFLYDFYDEEIGNFVSKRDLCEKLRAMSREIESFPLERKRKLDSRITVWERTGNHDGIEASLSMIPGKDRKICIDAHDLGCWRASSTVFATVNPRDFVDEGREETILDVTEIDEIENLALGS